MSTPRRRQAPSVDAVIATALHRDRAGAASPSAAAALTEAAEASLASIYTADPGLRSQALGGARAVIDGDCTLGDLVSRWRRLQAETRDARAAVVGALTVGEAAGAPVAQLARELGVSRAYAYRLLEGGGGGER